MTLNSFMVNLAVLAETLQAVLSTQKSKGGFVYPLFKDTADILKVDLLLYDINLPGRRDFMEVLRNFPLCYVVWDK